MLNIGRQESATVAAAEKNALAMTMYENRTVPLACWRPGLHARGAEHMDPRERA